MMFNVIFYFVIGVIGFLVISYFTGKKKTSLNRTSSEKLAKTLQKKFSRYINELNRKLRSPEDIQEEMLEALDDYKAAKVNEVKGLIVHLSNTETNIKNNLKKLENAKDNIDQVVRKMKNDANADPNVGGQMMMQMEQLDNSIEASNKSLQNIREQAMNINSAMVKFSNKIEMKRAEILTLISTYIASSCNSTIKFDIDISDLMSEYTTEMTIKERSNKIDEIVSNKITDTPQVEVSSYKYVEMYKNYK